MKTIRLSEFSKAPRGLRKEDGPVSALSFCEEVLLPALKSGQKIVLNLDGTLGISASFLKALLTNELITKWKASNSRQALTFESNVKTYERLAHRFWDS